MSDAMSETYEAVIGGARWRLTLHDGGAYEVSRRCGSIWDDVLAGTGGLAGVRDAARALGLVDGMARARTDVLLELVGVAERTRPAGGVFLSDGTEVPF
jgi:hypothetical protein